MTTVTVKFKNYNDEPIYVQVDPWAGVYILKKDDEIVILAESENSSPSFDVFEDGRTRIFVIVDSTEYYVILNGQRVLWTDYYIDPRLCVYCLKLKEAQDETGELFCTCEKSIRARSS